MSRLVDNSPSIQITIFGTNPNVKGPHTTKYLDKICINELT